MSDVSVSNTNDNPVPLPAGAWPTSLAVSLLLVAPVLSVWFLLSKQSVWFTAGGLPTALAVLLLFWSPLPFSAPALLLQDTRDAALPEHTLVDRLTRPFKLIPFLAFNRTSPVQAEMRASLAGFLAAVVLVVLAV